MSGTWSIVAGFALVAFTLREMFHDLFHPTESGSVSDVIARTLFSLFRLRPSMLPLAGPLALVIVITSWALSLALGFALIYWPLLPTAFQLRTSNSPDIDHGFAAAFYFSLEVLTTLGLGEFAPNPPWLRIVVGLHSLMGIGFITASVSWVVLLFPALSRIRMLARRSSLLAEASEKSGIDVVSGESHDLLATLALDLIRARVDLIHFPITYYFRSESRRASLAHSIPYLVKFAEAGSRPQCTERVRLAATTLRVALDDFADLLANRFLHMPKDDPAAVFRAFIEHHRIERDQPE